MKCTADFEISTNLALFFAYCKDSGQDQLFSYFKIYSYPSYSPILVNFRIFKTSQVVIDETTKRLVILENNATLYVVDLQSFLVVTMVSLTTLPSLHVDRT